MSTKSAILSFLRQFRIELESRLAAQYASASELVALQNTVENSSGDDSADDSVDTSNFVLQEDGKGLSSNDFTDADKALLDSLSNSPNDSSESIEFTSSDLDYIFQ